MAVGAAAGRLVEIAALERPAEAKRMLVIVNPYATTMSDRLKGLVIYALQGRYEVEAIDTQRKGHATELCREAAREGDLEVYFDDIVDAHERIWDMLENYKEVVEALEDTNESVISHRVNDILRVLTSISVIVLPLTLIASIWGMNVGVPGEQDMTGFWIVVGAMAAILIGMVIYFRRRGWL